MDIEVAVVGVGDLGRNVALADPVHVVGGYIQWPDDRVQAIVHALHDLAVVALVLGGVGACGQLAFNGGLRQQAASETRALTASMQVFRLFLRTLKSPL